MPVPGPYPFHGEVEWLSPAEAGRRKPPTGGDHATTAWREDVGVDGIASFVLRGFDPARARSRADGRWLVPQPDGRFEVRAGDVVVIAEGARPVARFFVDAVDPASEVLTDDELRAIEARCDAASPGPWQSFVEGRDHLSGDDFIRVGLDHEDDPDMYVSRHDESGLAPASAADLDFIAHARQDIPRLVAEIRRLLYDMGERS